MIARWFLSTSLLVLTVAPATQARYARVEVENVPVARLIENLEKVVKDKPKAVEAKLNLARAHAMAFAAKSDELPTRKGNEAAGVWFGYEPKIVPFGEVKKTDDREQQAKAFEHRDQALKLYAQCVEAEPENFSARLGFAWLTEHGGKKEDAVKHYRKLIADAWDKKEKDLKFLGLGGQSITMEAGGYLVPLLDADKDKDEIAELKDRIAKHGKLPRPITPIAIPLFDDLTAVDLEDGRASVAFDADGSGLGKTWTWITPKAAWLVYDPKKDGKITSGLQLFGNVTFWMFWSDGYQALGSLDDDGDGRLMGKELDGLALWHDANGNGVADPGEVKPLSEYSIVALACRSEVLKSHPDKIQYQPKGVTFKDGKTRPTFDLILKAK